MGEQKLSELLKLGANKDAVDENGKAALGSAKDKAKLFLLSYWRVEIPRN